MASFPRYSEMLVKTCKFSLPCSCDNSVVRIVSTLNVCIQKTISKTYPINLVCIFSTIVTKKQTRKHFEDSAINSVMEPLTIYRLTAVILYLPALYECDLCIFYVSEFFAIIFRLHRSTTYVDAAYIVPTE